MSSVVVARVVQQDPEMRAEGQQNERRPRGYEVQFLKQNKDSNAAQPTDHVDDVVTAEEFLLAKPQWGHTQST